MRSRARLHATASGWATVRSEPPFSVRCTPGVAHLVGSAAGPLGGDDLVLEVELDPGAEVAVRSVAAQMVHPGRAGERSHTTYDVALGTDALLRWQPEPTVLVAGAHHDSRATVGLGPGARMVWREELVAGRHGEGSGSVVSTLRVVLDGTPLVHHELRVGPDAGPAWDGPGGAGRSRAFGTVVVVDPHEWAVGPPGPGTLGYLGDHVAFLMLEGPGVLACAHGTPPQIRSTLGQAIDVLTQHWPAEGRVRSVIATA